MNRRFHIEQAKEWEAILHKARTMTRNGERTYYVLSLGRSFTVEQIEDRLEHHKAEAAKYQSQLPRIVALLALCAVFTGCTVTPEQPREAGPAWSVSGRNSGFIGFDEAGNGILDAWAVARYNGLAERYGQTFLPEVLPGDGIEDRGDQTWTITPWHLMRFYDMVRMQRKAEVPQ
jgi:hypothetical protein